MSVSVLAKNTCETVGEGPFWEEATNSLLYVDIVKGDVHRWSAISGDDTVLHFHDTVSFIVPRSVGGGYVIGLGRTVSSLDWDSMNTEVLCEVDHGTQNRFNDAKCDSSGRLWAGTMGYMVPPAQLDRHQGSLYSVDHDHKVRKHVDNLDISNGMAWSLDNTVMYFIDSIPRKIYALDFDLTTGTLSNQRVAVDFGEGTFDTLGNPDGMCIDSEDKIWVACYDAGKVVRFDVQTGTQIQTINFPVKKTTSCCFGGPNFSELYVTTCRLGLTDEEFHANQPLAGSVFKVTGLGVHGFAAPTYNG
jgi:gluconolactonase